MRGARPFAALEAVVATAVRARPGEILVAAVSGGPDSAALAALLGPIARAAGATLVVAHVNAALRPSAWQDEAVTASLAATLGVRCVAVSLAPGPPDEARLRTDRYAALARVAVDVGATRVFTGHHAADQAETVLLALLRGTGMDGLAGMAPERELASPTGAPPLRLVRPLLRVEPADLHAFVAAHHLPFAVDPTNADPAYRRNAVRQALADLRESFPHLDAAIARCAQIVRDDRDGSPAARARARLRAAVSEATGDARNLTFERLNAAAGALERRTPGRHFLRRGVELIVE
ncbi:MAG: hypothetical protein NVS2B8_12750 [Vulcanimicrobiaceae bacterium]